MMMQLTGNQAPVLMRRQVMQMAELASATIDRFIEAGVFPEPHSECGGVELWKRSDVESWTRSRKAAAARLRITQK